MLSLGRRNNFCEDKKSVVAVLVPGGLRGLLRGSAATVMRFKSVNQLVLHLSDTE